MLHFLRCSHIVRIGSDKDGIVCPGLLIGVGVARKIVLDILYGRSRIRLRGIECTRSGNQPSFACMIYSGTAIVRIFNIKSSGETYSGI